MKHHSNSSFSPLADDLQEQTDPPTGKHGHDTWDRVPKTEVAVQQTIETDEWKG